MRFLFIMAAMFLSAGLAELAGLEPIIGAFLAGLSLNRLVSEGSELSSRIEFFGSAFFIPVFLISVGMLVNLEVVTDDPSILVRAGVFSLVAVGTKVVAAFIAGKIFGYSGTEIGVMASLSTARAAATLAGDGVCGAGDGRADARVRCLSSGTHAQRLRIFHRSRA